MADAESLNTMWQGSFIEIPPGPTNDGKRIQFAVRTAATSAPGQDQKVTFDQTAQNNNVKIDPNQNTIKFDPARNAVRLLHPQRGTISSYGDVAKPPDPGFTNNQILASIQVPEAGFWRVTVDHVMVGGTKKDDTNAMSNLKLVAGSIEHRIIHNIAPGGAASGTSKSDYSPDFWFNFDAATTVSVQVILGASFNGGFAPSGLERIVVSITANQEP